MGDPGYLVVIEQAEGNYSAYSPDLPGCISTGATVEQTAAKNSRTGVTAYWAYSSNLS